MNLLLAIIYSKFKFKIENNMEGFVKERNEYLHMKFEEYASGDEKNRYLDKLGMYKFMVVIHSLVERSNDDDFELGEDELILR